ncbi:winged helix-turn-helix domain-containing protein [Stenotrophomonas maltophilia]
MQQRIFDLLLLFVAQPNRLFTRQEIFDLLWPGLVVEDSNLSQSVWLLRKALGTSRRDWLKTIAKRGYIFHPPHVVQKIDESEFSSRPESTVEDDGSLKDSPGDESAISPLEAGPIEYPPSAYGDAGQPIGSNSNESNPRNSTTKLVLAFKWVAIAFATVFCITLVVRQVRPQVNSMTHVALIPINTNRGVDATWASELLRQWTGWKLQLLPSVLLLGNEGLASGKQTSTSRTVLLSAVYSSDRQSVTLRARIQQPGGEQVLERIAKVGQVPATVDLLSKDILAKLTPEQWKPWPVLDVSTEGARRYEEISTAFDRGDWDSVRRKGTSLLIDEPGFGLLHYQVAIAQSNLSHTLDAIRQMEVARGILSELPDAAKTSLSTRQLELDPRRVADAEQSLRDLVSKYPDAPVYRQRLARVLIQNGKFRQAISQVENRIGDFEDIDTKYQREILLSDAFDGLGLYDLTKQHAKRARVLAAASGPSMQVRAADAAFREATASDTAEEAASSYSRAAALYASAGQSAQAEHVGIVASLISPASAPDMSLINRALDDARRSGSFILELELEIMLSVRSASRGEKVHWMQQALQTSRKMGDLVTQATIESRLALDDLSQLRVNNAQARAVELKAMGIEGRPGALVNEALTEIYLVQNRLAEAGSASQRTLDMSSGSRNKTFLYASAACSKLLIDLYTAETRLLQDRRAACMKASNPHDAISAALADTEAALLLNQKEAAEASFQRATGLLNESPATSSAPVWIASPRRIKLAELALRLGKIQEAKNIAVSVVERAKPGELTQLGNLELAVVRAEIAAALGNWEECRRQATYARHQLPEAMVSLRQRLDILAMIDAQKHSKPAETLAIAQALFVEAQSHGDARLQAQIVSAVPAVVSSRASESKNKNPSWKRLPGANLAWLSASP